MISKINTTFYHRTVMVLCDLALVSLLLYLCYVLFPGIIPPPISYPGKSIFFVSSISMLFAQWFTLRHWVRGMPSLQWMMTASVKSAVIYTIVCFTILRIIYNAGEFFRFSVIFLPALFISLLVVNVMLFYVFRSQQFRNRRNNVAVYVGDAESIRRVCTQIDDNLQAAHLIRGYYADAPLPDNDDLPKYLGTVEQLLERLSPTDDGEGKATVQDVFCCASPTQMDVNTLMRACDRALVRFHLIPFPTDDVLSSLTLEQINNTYIFTAHLHPIFYPENRILKRGFDIGFSLVVCLVMLPLLPLVAWLIKRQSKGSMLFAQLRTGLDGRTFRCYKFRSMHVNNESDTRQATLHDSRIFPFGAFMRRTNLDELPQFFNVLRGDMSIVGPRPHMKKHTEEYAALVEKFMVRHFSKPGITGYAQVNGSRGETREVEDMEERIRKDIYYIEHWSFWLDIRIILKTIKTIFVPDKRAY